MAKRTYRIEGHGDRPGDGWSDSYAGDGAGVVAVTPLSPGEARAITVSAWACRCARCGYQWTSLAAKIPASCPPGPGRGCGSRGWRQRAGIAKRGRPRVSP